MVKGKGICFRSAGSCKYGSSDPDQMYSQGIKTSFREIWKTVDCSRGDPFVLVGAAVDIRYTMQAGIAAVLMIFVGLMFRAVGVSLCMLGTKLNKKSGCFV